MIRNPTPSMKPKRTPLAIALALLAFLPTLNAQDPALGQAFKSFEIQATRTLGARYLLFLPKGYAADANKKWPLILFLHGAGERGSDLAKVAVHGPPKIVQSQPDFPFVVVSPQCPTGQRWNNETVLALLDHILATCRIDTTRVYLTGLSMGGYGTWSVGLTHPERFAAIVPICGGGDPITLLLADPTKVEALKSLPVWAFHGAKDPVVGLVESERMIEALKRFGCTNVQLTVYPDAQHDSWTESYANPALYDWFLKHHR